MKQAFNVLDRRNYFFSSFFTSGVAGEQDLDAFSQAAFCSVVQDLASLLFLQQEAFGFAQQE